MGLHPSACLTGSFRRVLSALLACFWLVASPVSAQTAVAPGSVCHASGSLTTDVADVAKWVCAGSEVDWKAARNFIRHDLRDRPVGAPAPRHAEFDRHEFDRLTVEVIGDDGTRRARSYTFGDTKLGASNLYSMVELPEIDATPVAVIMTLDGGDYPEALVGARLMSEPTIPIIAGLPHLIAALLCGLLIAPMVFDLGYYRALREPFPLFHALFCVMAFLQTAALSGLVPLMISIPLEMELMVTYFSLDLMVAATILFGYNFIEKGTLGGRQRIVLVSITTLTLAIGALTTFRPSLFGFWIDHVYFGAYFVILSSYFAVLASARRRGSRAAPYLILGLAPFAFIVLIQIVSVFTLPAQFVFDETWPQNFALLFEVVATALAVADRFIAIKQERDKAVSEARTLEALSEHDELTGLLNRRALEARYPDLVDDGFHAMAVVDIDHFKAINDIYGHPVGDAVLRCTADALEAVRDPDLLAFRIGGEEFLLLLRGTDAAKRAEARRRAITARTLAEMEGLDRPVTASMGFLDFAPVAHEAGIDFATLYTRVDQLLYEAKCAGRNRTVEYALELFDPENEEREEAAA